MSYQEPRYQEPVGQPAAAGGNPIAGPPQQMPPGGYVVQPAVERSSAGLRVFQIVAALLGAALFVVGLVAVFRVDFGAGFFQTTGDIAGYGFSPALAVAAVLLGGATLVATMADQDRTGTAVLGLLTLLVGIGALILQDRGTQDVSVDRRSAALFIVVGAVVFVLGLIPWWSRRRPV